MITLRNLNITSNDFSLKVSSFLIEQQTKIIGIVLFAFSCLALSFYFIYQYYQRTFKIKYIQWKIERYEELNKFVRTCVLEYLKFHKLGEIDQLLQQETSPSNEWLNQLSPVFRYCQKSFRKDKERFDKAYLNEVRNSYNQEFLAKLRVAAQWAKMNPTSVGADHVNGLCHQFYTTNDLNFTCQQILQTFVELGKEETKERKLSQHHLLNNDPKYALINNLFEAHQLINAVPIKAKAPQIDQWANSFFRGHINGIPGIATFDPNMQSNPVHILMTKKIVNIGSVPAPEVIVKDIAMGSPTIETGNGIATINPEFQGFLRHYKTKGLVHLYINNQELRARSRIKGDESVRCKILHDLAENDFKNTLYVISFNHNSSFYHQEERKNTLYSGALFQKELVKEMFDHAPQETGNCIPSDLVTKFDLRNWSVDMAAGIHQNLFEGKEHLTTSERRIFIRIFYRNLARKILIETKANSYNESCKDRIDRGASSDAEDYAYLAILQNIMSEPKVIEFFKLLTFSRAIIVRKRSIITERLDRLIETVKFMIDHQSQLQKLHTKLFPNHKVLI